MLRVASAVDHLQHLYFLCCTPRRGSHFASCCCAVQELLDKRGHFQVPYLEDPNQGVYLFESSAIVKYLEDTYATSS